MIKIDSDILLPLSDSFVSDEKRFEWQMNLRANYLLLGDRQQKLQVDVVHTSKPILKTPIKWINQGELIAGSFASNFIRGVNIEFSDIDIYFKSHVDALSFMSLNGLIGGVQFKQGVTMQIAASGTCLNIIHGVHYDSPEDLISRFDIRACSIALDPCTNTAYSVRGTADDCLRKRIIYNPVPHNTSIARLIKYTKKGFGIDPYQRLFLAELIKSDMYNPDLEISTGYRAVYK
jgi:hypothetical protein